MPTELRTVPRGAASVPIRTLRADVVEGPDAGRACVAPSDRLTVGSAEGNDLVLADATVSRFHVELGVAASGVVVADLGSTNGTLAGAVRIERAVVPPGTVLRLGRTTLRVGEGEPAEAPVWEEEELRGLRGRTPAMRRLMARVERAAQSEAPVLVVGETGTGKELVARALHDLGPRARGPFVTVDCGALAPTLVASELFGHERGAFTGADRAHAGAFERASGGTVFLDEIGELPAPVQSALLGVLERRRFRRLGGSEERAADVRAVCATNRDLRAEINAGTFRADLYFRIAVVEIRTPPLREHPDDVPMLVEHFLRECGHDGPVEEVFSEPVLRQLAAHRFPGNVRELRNLVEAAVAIGEAPRVTDAVTPAVGAPTATPTDTIQPLLVRPYREARATLLSEFEGRYLARLLAAAGGNVSRAAREAHMDRSHLIELLQKHGLK